MNKLKHRSAPSGVAGGRGLPCVEYECLSPFPLGGSRRTKPPIRPRLIGLRTLLSTFPQGLIPPSSVPSRADSQVLGMPSPSPDRESAELRTDATASHKLQDLERSFAGILPHPANRSPQALAAQPLMPVDVPSPPGILQLAKKANIVQHVRPRMSVVPRSIQVDPRASSGWTAASAR